ncbi:MAG: FAD-dependent oxidoreductase, partial [bacterium]|nr:FAD-dependent oxidoreductase [bacterium]
MSEHDVPDFIVLGAGPAGLMFAKAATDRRRRVLVLEGADVVGGMSRSISFGGGTVDLGPHAIGTGLSRVREMFQSVLEGEYDSFQLSTGMLWDGEIYSYPPTLSELLKHRGLGYCTRAGVSLCLGRINPGLRDPESCLETSTRSYGRVLVDDCLRPYLHRLWGDELERVHPSWKPGRFNTGGVLSWIDHLFRGTGDVRILHPRRGMGDLYRRLSRHLQRLGCIVETSQRVERIVHSGERLESLVVRDVRSDEAREIGCEQSVVVSTLPVPVLLRLLDPVLPEEPDEGRTALGFRNTVICYFAADEVSVPRRHILYLNDEGFRSGRMTNYN